MNQQLIELSAEDYKQYFVNFNSLIDEIKQSNSKSQEDLAFFEKIIHRMITSYWEEHNQYKGKLFQNKLQNKFRNQSLHESRSSNYLKIVYYKTFVEEIIKDLSNNFKISLSTQQSHPSSTNEDIQTTLQPTEMHNFQNDNTIATAHSPQHIQQSANIMSGRSPLDINPNAVQFQHHSPRSQISINAPSPHSGHHQSSISQSMVNPQRSYASPGSGYTNDSMSAEEFSIVNTLNNMKHTPPSSIEQGEMRTFTCEECGMVFKRGADLSRHGAIHLPLLPHICNNCGKSFARKDALKRHYMTATCKRNKINQTYIENLMHLPKEKLEENLALPSRKKRKAEQS